MPAFKGKITTVLPEKSGTSKAGNPWRKREAIIEYSSGQYPQQVLFEMFNDEIERLNIQPGLEYELELDFKTRKCGDRYFLSASCWKATPVQNPAPQPTAPPSAQPASTPASAQTDNEDAFPF